MKQKYSIVFLFLKFGLLIGVVGLLFQKGIVRGVSFATLTNKTYEIQNFLSIVALCFFQ